MYKCSFQQQSRRVRTFSNLTLIMHSSIGNLDEEIYMKLPPDFTPRGPQKVCRLRKSFCGLKESPSQQFAKLSRKMEAYGFMSSYVGHCLLVFLRVLVQDVIILVGNDVIACKEFKDYLHSCFHIKDVSHVKYFLGIEAAHGPK